MRVNTGEEALNALLDQWRNSSSSGPIRRFEALTHGGLPFNAVKGCVISTEDVRVIST
jgi:hypothetical protein